MSGVSNTRPAGRMRPAEQFYAAGSTWTNWTLNSRVQNRWSQWCMTASSHSNANCHCGRNSFNQAICLTFQLRNHWHKLNLNDYSAIVSQLLEEFDRRFREFQAMEPQFSLFSTPYAVDVESVPLQMELVELQCDTILKQTYTEIGIPDFYTYLSRTHFPKLLDAAARIMAMFGSTYVCEQFFSSMKLNKSALRSRLTDEHLRATLRLATAHDIKPNLDVLVSANAASLAARAHLTDIWYWFL